MRVQEHQSGRSSPVPGCELARAKSVVATASPETARAADSSEPEAVPVPVEHFVRNTAARDDYRLLGAVRLRRPLEGIHWVALLKATEEKASVTDCRRERKSPIRVTTFDAAIEALKARGIELRRREANSDQGRVDTTLTYYGSAATFYNHQTQTKIRMRIRFYLSHGLGANGEKVDVRRAPSTSSSGFLELKVKNPRAAEESFVDKYRLVVPDSLLARLVNLDLEEGRFREGLSEIADEIKSSRDETGGALNDPRRVDAMFSLIASLGGRDRRFVRPSLVVTYARSGYKYDEKGYAFSPQAQDAVGSLWGRRPPKEQQTMDVQYQLTVDRDVRAHYPLLPLGDVGRMPVEAHFDPRFETEIARYPSDVRVLELKEPKRIAGLPRAARSETHNAFVDLLLKPMETDIQWGDFDEQVGKYGTFRRRIFEAHDPRKIVNEKVELDFGAPLSLGVPKG